MKSFNIPYSEKEIFIMSYRLTNDDIIRQIASTMAVENMPLTERAYENLIRLSKGEVTSDQIVDELKEYYTNIYGQ